MPEYLAPGVYVEEVSFRAKSIEGVGTSTTAFVGPTLKGPLSEKPESSRVLTPEVITSFGEFERVFGGLGNLLFNGQETTNYMAHSVKAFFDNGGSRLYVARAFTKGASSDGVAKSDALLSIGADPKTDEVRFNARTPGSLLNVQITLVLKETKVTGTSLEKAKPGSLLRLSVTGAKPAQLVGKVPPFSFDANDKLVLLINGVKKEITFTSANRAEVVGDEVPDPAAIAIPAGTNLVISISGQADQTIPLPAGNSSLAAIAAAINSQMRFGFAAVRDGDQLVIGCDAAGKAITMGVNAVAPIGFAAPTNGTGTGRVQDLTNVTAGEMNSLLQDGAIDAVADVIPATGELVLKTKATGKNAKIQVSDDTPQPIRTKLGLPASEAVGEDELKQPTYFALRGDTWHDSDGNPQTGEQMKTIAAADLLTFSLVVQDASGEETTFDDLGFSPEHPRWAGEILKQTPSRKSDAMLNPVSLDIGSNVLKESDLAFELHDSLFGTGKPKTIALTGGNDGTQPGLAAYDDALNLLETIDDIAIIAAPGHSEFPDFASIQSKLISHAERMKFRIAVLDVPKDKTPGEAQEVRARIDTTYAAIYYPWIIVGNPAARPGNDLIPKEIALPPSGFLAGVYARTDIQRGVWKAPANEIVRGAIRFERDITVGQQGILNPLGVNCLRYFPGRGYRVWGARTASSDPEWKYVNVRRYFIYLENSIDRSTQWAVFEPNGERLWANVRETVAAFLYNEWRSGALLGAKPEHSYFVRCDRSTMTQNDLDNGRLICEIGVAALKPAEFVIFRIGQKTADART